MHLQAICQVHDTCAVDPNSQARGCRRATGRCVTLACCMLCLSLACYASWNTMCLLSIRTLRTVGAIVVLPSRWAESIRSHAFCICCVLFSLIRVVGPSRTRPHGRHPRCPTRAATGHRAVCAPRRRRRRHGARVSLPDARSPIAPRHLR